MGITSACRGSQAAVRELLDKRFVMTKFVPLDESHIPLMHKWLSGGEALHWYGGGDALPYCITIWPISRH
ncbi:hypothetical protein ACFL1X_11565 [Candidatus Hydrogenedentota bacterium]